MGTTTNGILAYGFNLGGGGSDWEIADTGEYGEWEPDWCGEDEDVVIAAERKLKESVGFAETDWRVDGYFEREREAEKRVGVEFEGYCSGEYTMWALAAATITSHRGDAIEVDFAALEQQRIDEDWDGKLKRACEVLGLKPKQERPRWLLLSYWG